MDGKNHGEESGENVDVKHIEAEQSGTGDLWPAEQDPLEAAPDTR